MLDGVKVDYADLLQFTLQHWPLIEGVSPSNEELRAAAEHYLTTHRAIHRLYDYHHMQEVVTAIVSAVQTFYEGLTHQLTPLLEDYGVDVTVRLSRFMHKDIVIHLEKPYHGP